MPSSSSRTSRRFLGAASTLALGSSAVLQLGHHGHDGHRDHTRPGSVRHGVTHVASARAQSQVVAESVVRATPVRRPVPHRPSGAIPMGNLPGWRQVLAQDFTGSTLPRGWSRYSGRPGGNPNGWWAASHAAVRAQDLHLVGDWSSGRFVTGGVMATGFSSTYGKYEVRFKVSRGQGVPYALLLWPTNENWPSGGEIDFAEDGGGSRRGLTATLHYGGRDSQVQRRLRADFTQFQTVGVEWTPGRIVYTLNGRPWAVVTGPGVPSGPMRLAMQLEAGRGDRWSPAPTRATPRTVDLVIDWVVGYRMA